VTLSAPSPGAAIATASATASMTGGAGPNRPPVAVADAQLNVACGESGASHVIGNDTDPDEEAVTLVAITGSTGPSNYFAADPSSGSIIFTAPFIRNATYSVTYTIRDSRGLQAVGTLAVKAIESFPGQCSGGYNSVAPPVDEGGE
jgi:Bacterial Ig domain